MVHDFVEQRLGNTSGSIAELSKNFVAGLSKGISLCYGILNRSACSIAFGSVHP